MKGMKAVQLIFSQISVKRLEQIQQWGGPEHDDLHTPEEWTAFIGKQLSYYVSGNEPRDRLLKIAALAIAATESFDRNEEANKILRDLS